MQDKELYSQLLGVKEPWKVSDVRIDFAELKVDTRDIGDVVSNNELT